MQMLSSLRRTKKEAHLQENPLQGHSKMKFLESETNYPEANCKSTFGNEMIVNKQYK